MNSDCFWSASLIFYVYLSLLKTNFVFTFIFFLDQHSYMLFLFSSPPCLWVLLKVLMVDSQTPRTKGILNKLLAHISCIQMKIMVLFLLHLFYLETIITLRHMVPSFRSFEIKDHRIVALRSKHKLHFVDGALPRPPDEDHNTI
jgi:hypothetical protein